jgi:transcriptional regulator with XRE-family HTH domain
MQYAVGRCLIPDWLEKFDMTQKELAEVSGSTEAQVSKWSRNIEKMSIQNAKNVAAIFGCHIDDLYEWHHTLV